MVLDEPTTGLDLQSRTGLWDEVARLARDDGTTVFLTTQYLEEADVLADRVGIIDHGQIVAEDTPARLKADLGAPTVEVSPASPGAMAAVLERFAITTRNDTGTLTLPLCDGEQQLADVVRTLDQAGLRVASLQLHQPTRPQPPRPAARNRMPAVKRTDPSGLRRRSRRICGRCPARP